MARTELKKVLEPVSYTHLLPVPIMVVIHPPPPFYSFPASSPNSSFTVPQVDFVKELFGEEAGKL